MSNGVPLIVAAERRASGGSVHEAVRPGTFHSGTVTLSPVELTDVVYLSPSAQVTDQNTFHTTSALSGGTVQVLHTVSDQTASIAQDPAISATAPELTLLSTETDQEVDPAHLASSDPSLDLQQLSNTASILDDPTVLKIGSGGPTSQDGLGTYGGDESLVMEDSKNQEAFSLFQHRPSILSHTSESVQDKISETIPLQSSDLNLQNLRPSEETLEGSSGTEADSALIQPLTASESSLLETSPLGEDGTVEKNHSAGSHTAHAILSANPSYLTNQEYISALSPYLYQWQNSEEEPASSTPKTEQSDQVSSGEPNKQSTSAVLNEFILLKDTANAHTPESTVASAPATVPEASSAVTDVVLNSDHGSSLLSLDNQVGVTGSYATRLGSLAGGLLGLGGLGAAGLSGVDLGSVVSSATELIRNVLPISKRRDDKPLPVPYRVRRPYAPRPYLHPVHRLRENNHNSRRDSYSPNNGFLAVRGPQGQIIGPLAEKNYFHNARLRHAQRKAQSHRIILPLRPPEIPLQSSSNSRYRPHQSKPNDRTATRKKDSGVPNGFIAIVPPSRFGSNPQSTPTFSNFREHTHVPNTNLFFPPPPTNDYNAIFDQDEDEITDDTLYDVIDRNEEYIKPTTDEKFNQLPQDFNAAEDSNTEENENNYDKFANQGFLVEDTVLNTDNSLSNAFQDQYSGNDQAYAASVADFQQKSPSGGDILQRIPFSPVDSGFINNQKERELPVLVSTLHTIASVEGLNRIVGTNVFASVVPLVTSLAVISFKNSVSPSVTRHKTDIPFRKPFETSFKRGSVEANVRKVETSKLTTPTFTFKTSTKRFLKGGASKFSTYIPIETVSTDLTKLLKTEIHSKIAITKSINKIKNDAIATVLRNDIKKLNQNIESDVSSESKKKQKTDFPKSHHRDTTNAPEIFRSSLSLESSIEEITENTPWYFQATSTDPYGKHFDDRVEELVVEANAPSSTEFSASGIATPELKFRFEKSTRLPIKKISTKSVRKSLNRIRTRLADRIRLTLRPSQRNSGVASSQREDSKHTTLHTARENNSDLTKTVTKSRFQSPWRRTSESINISDLSRILLSSVQQKKKSSIQPSVHFPKRVKSTGSIISQRKSSSYVLSVTKGSFTTILGPDVKTLATNARTTKSIDSSTLIHGTSTLYDGDFAKPTLPLLNIHDITEISNGVDSPQTNYITRTEFFTRTITATKTAIQKSGTSISTKTILITSTLKPITVISTIIGTSTNIVTLNTATPTRVIQLVKETQRDSGTQIDDWTLDQTFRLPTTNSPYTTKKTNPPTTSKTHEVTKDKNDDIYSKSNIMVPIQITTEKQPKRNEHEDKVMKESTRNRIVLSAGVGPRLSSDDTISLGEKIHQDVNEDNEVNRVVINPGVNRQVVVDRPAVVTHSCQQPCRVSAHEVCRKKHGVYQCTCKPGYARADGNETCRAVSTYQLKILLERVRDLPLTFRHHFEDESSSEHKALTLLTRSGVQKSLALSPLVDKVKNVELLGYEHVRSQGDKFRHLKTGVLADLMVQLDKDGAHAADNKENLRQTILRSIALKNFSLGDKDLIVSRHTEAISTEDFNECTSADYNDCHDYAYCYNLEGGFTCSCRDGMVDSGPLHAPGRVCSSATLGCETCNYHGECASSNTSISRFSDRGSGSTERGLGSVVCQCHRWYAGARCQINLRVLLIAAVVAAVVLVAILCCCCYLCCRGNASSGGSRAAPPLVFTGADGFMRHRGSSLQPGLERRAMLDSSSDTTVTSHPSLIPSSLVGMKGISSHSSVTGDTSHDEGPRWARRHGPPSSARTAEASSTYQEERSVGSVGVVNIANMGGADALPIARLIPRAKQSKFNRYPPSLTHSGSVRSHPNAEKIQRQLLSRIAPSGVGTFTCRSRGSRGSSDDRGWYSSRNGAVLAGPVSLHPGGRRSRSSDGGDLHRQRMWSSSQSSLTAHGARVNDAGSTVSGRVLCEARSFDETTVRPSVCSAASERRSVRTAASSRTGFTDDHHTMAERDAASTFVMPETQLFRPVMDFDNQSDVSLMDDFPHLPYSYSRTPSTRSGYQH